MEKLKIMLEDDRLTVAAILVKNGYIVRQMKERVEGKKSSGSWKRKYICSSAQCLIWRPKFGR